MPHRFVSEVGRIDHDRTGRGLEEARTINSPADAYHFLRGEMAALDQEQIRVLNLNSKNAIISAPLIYRGTINDAYLRVTEIFRTAVIEHAAAVIVAHTHRSGDPQPSTEDVEVTRIVVEVGRLLDIDVRYHIVIGSSGFVSMRTRGLGFGR